ncbi:protein YhfH [Brevibacillus massiliensis]|jgi:predicted nucleic acid-binding Zn ribbon protein|uniref:protein YhfH n=1 Tax=Brevibacillus massiliensis TaxID=1118054 RepID=UPI000310D7F0|nr:protein YhfH [Brevibacillus massiliensis]
MMAVRTFFATLPKKCCIVCGNPIVDQAESYMPECFHCQEERLEKENVRGR